MTLRAIFLESRLGDQVDGNLVKVQSYSTIRQDLNTAGGGALLHVRNDLQAKVFVESKTSQKGK